MDIDLNACLGGQKRAWDDFVRQSAPVIYAAVRRAMMRSGPCSQQDFDDRAQDVYVRLLQHDCKLLRTFDPKRASLSTWLTLIARTVVHEHSQKRRMQIVPLSDNDLAPAMNGSIDREPIAMSSAVALDALTERQRLVLEMLFDEGMTVEQAAHRLEVDPQTIRSTKHKAMCRLRELFSVDSLLD